MTTPQYLAHGSYEGQSFWRRDLRGANASFSSFNDARFNYADLSGATLEGSDLSGATLVRAKLVGANLTDANLEGANLNGADLTDAILNGCYLGVANLKNVIGLTPEQLSKAQGVPEIAEINPALFPQMDPRTLLYKVRNIWEEDGTNDSCVLDQARTRPRQAVVIYQDDKPRFYFIVCAKCADKFILDDGAQLVTLKALRGLIEQYFEEHPIEDDKKKP